MSVPYFHALFKRKATLTEAIKNEQQRPQPDWQRVARLKKLRLALKDKMHALRPRRQPGLFPLPGGGKA